MSLKDKVQSVLIAFILFNFLILYATANYTDYTEANPNIWDSVWYVIEALIYVLVAIYGYVSNNQKNFKLSWLSMIIFFVIRLGWEMKATFWGLSINQKEMIAAMFLINAITVFWNTYLPLINRKWQQLK